jgi:hypothetical protein
VYSLKNNKITKTSNLGSPWSFLRESRGPCKFTLFNEDNYNGRKVQYGETSRTRIASKDGKAKGGWKVRSLIIEPLASNCHIVLKAEQDKGIVDHIKSFNGTVYIEEVHPKGYFTHSGPSNFSNISGLSTVHSTFGDSSCRYTLYNENNFAGRQITVEKVSKPFRGDWRIRSMKITNKVSNSTKLVPRKPGERVKPIKSVRRNQTVPAQRGTPNKNEVRDHRKTNSRSEVSLPLP